MLDLRGKRYAAFVTCIVGFIGIALYPIVISPMIDSSYYKKAQEKNRVGIRQEEVQPGNMKIWSDPFGKKY